MMMTGMSSARKAPVNARQTSRALARGVTGYCFFRAMR